MKKKPINNGEKPQKDKKGRFVEGNIGGPGKPPGSLSITALIKAELEKIPELKTKEGLDGNPAKKKWITMLIQKFLHQAVAQGDRATQKLIWNYIDGLPKGSFDVTSMGDKIDGVVILPAKNS